jgi:DnaJ-class molecular chaperone|tara:strand:+ start:1427 stop:1627 length:201 start_codon:yes stop_codon:yes gene_type:complete
MDINHLAKELAKIRAVLAPPLPAGSECEECAGTGMILVTRSVVDPIRGGYETEYDELCPACEGEGI